MANSREVTLTEMMDYCEKHDAKQWFKDLCASSVINKKTGLSTPISLFAVKAAFVNHFDDYKEYRAKKPKKKTWKDTVKDW